jgi:molecular chaperone Hsp33
LSDAIHKFLLADGGVRIESVKLEQVWQTIAAQRGLPGPVQDLLGQLCAASVLLSATLKFQGSLVLQLAGDGPVRLAVVECRQDFSIRAAIKLSEHADIAPDSSFTALVNPHGKGRFMVVLDPQDRGEGQQPYTGIVGLSGETLAQCLDAYFASSEQLPTHLMLAADGNTAAGMLIQRLPAEGGKAVIDEDAWNRAKHLAATATAEELLTLAPEVLVRRLFWEEDLTLFKPATVRFECSCSRLKVARVLRMLGQAEVQSILDEMGQVTVNCDYCNKVYVFDPVDSLAALRPDTVLVDAAQKLH